jgi:hypothetical protein
MQNNAKLPSLQSPLDKYQRPPPIPNRIDTNSHKVGARDSRPLPRDTQPPPRSYSTPGSHRDERDVPRVARDKPVVAPPTKYDLDGPKLPSVYRKRQATRGF